MISRRNFLFGSGLAALGASYTAVKNQASDLPLISEITLPIGNLTPDFSNFRIAFIADIHLGHYLSQDHLRTIVSMVNEQKPDLILMGGDYIWREKSALAQCFSQMQPDEYPGFSGEALSMEVIKSCAKILTTLSAPHGVFGVLGNHDQWEIGPDTVSIFAEQKILLLKNDEHLLRRGSSTIRITGVDDYWTGFPSVPKSWHQAKTPNEIRIILSHNPDFISYEVEPRGIKFDLALCGHTHAGQIRLPFIGPIIFNVNDRRFMEGLVKSEISQGTVFTTRGIGMVELPVRINCPAEIAIITLAI